MYKTDINVTLKLTSESVKDLHAPTVKMVHNNYNTYNGLSVHEKQDTLYSKTSTKTIGANFRPGARYLVAASLIKSVISSSPL